MNKPLHGLRGAAATTVVLGHYEIIPGAPSLGVILFFVLSGFLIGKLYLEQPFSRQTVFTYLVARFARVYPLFAVVVLTVGGSGYFFPSTNVFAISPLQIVRNLMLVGENLTIWTISTEFQFYLFFIALWALRSKVGSAAKVIWPAFGISLFVALFWSVDDSRTGLPGYLHIFSLGILISMVPQAALDRVAPACRWALPLLLVGYLATFLTASKALDIYLDPIANAVCAGVLVASLSASQSSANRLLSLPPMIWAGEVSFGIYLLHRPAARMVELAAPDLPLVQSQASKLALTFALAHLAFKVIERPARQFIRQRAKTLHPDPEPGAASAN